MTPRPDPGSLAALLDQATPGPWEAATGGSFYAAELRAPSPYNGFALVKVMTNPDADLALIALAPDMARLLIKWQEWAQNPDRKASDEAALHAEFAALNQKAGSA